jgi:dipeptidyl aminopeptidase/acylaminoacyl peptidase
LSRVGYSALIQYLVNHGYAIYAINNRGSSGYGKTFYYLDDRKHGDVDLGDVVESKQMLIELGQINQHRIGIIGGSYGGYMVLAALAFRPDVFDVGVDIFGVSNWVRTLQSIPPWWESFRKALEQEMGDFF